MNNIIEYKGYIAHVQYSKDDKCFYGKIEMINDLITFEAVYANELETNFQIAVDEYLKTCKTLNREPNKAYKGVFNIRIKPELHMQASKEAIKNGVSLNNYVQEAIEQKLKRAIHAQKPH